MARNGTGSSPGRAAARLGCGMACYLIIYWALDPSGTVRVAALLGEALAFSITIWFLSWAARMLLLAFAIGQPSDRAPGETRWARAHRPGRPAR